jgi:uncharacterized protein (TIGR03118 family)
MQRSRWSWLSVFLIAPLGACPSNDDRYEQIDLISDELGVAARSDIHVINSWGLDVNDEGEIWIANNGTGVASVVDGAGRPSDAYPGGLVSVGDGITGVVANPGPDLVIHGRLSEASEFVFVTDGGQVLGFNDAIAEEGVIAFDGSAEGNAYTGVAVRRHSDGTTLYAANFAKGRIDVFDKTFDLLRGRADDFVDPSLPADFAPFNVAVLDDEVWVAFARRGDDGDEERGAGLGYVSVFDPDGAFVRRFASQGRLDAPWAIVRAPDSFGEFGGDILIGNFGDGWINAFDSRGRDRGYLRTTSDAPLAIDGLWGLLPLDDALYFAAGPDDEVHGLFGRLEPE